MTKKIKSTMKPGSIPAGNPTWHHSLDSLLRTIRRLARYEDTVCEFSEEAKSTGGLSDESKQELLGILEDIPSHELQYDVEVLRDMLTHRSASSKAAKTSVSGRKRTAKSHKPEEKPRRRSSK